MDEVILFFVSAIAGLVGALLGLGGGILIVPVLSLGFHVHIRYAIAASLVSIVATSSGAAAGFLKDRLTNLRLAVLLEVGTVCGAMVGFLVSGLIPAHALFLIFGSFLLLSAALVFRRRDGALAKTDHPWSQRLKLAGSGYSVEQVPLGLAVMFVAGALSALLGIGSGVFKVMAMDGAMKLPLKVSSATSNFMIGVTATASAGAYFLRGDIRPEITVPVAMGVIAGSWMGGRWMTKIPSSVLRKAFVFVMVVVAAQMIYRGLR